MIESSMDSSRRFREMMRDPVCGMEIDSQRSNWVTEYGGETYYFCSEGCMKAFNTHPSEYINRSPGVLSSHGHGSYGGCCGVGAGRGWMRYFYIGLFLLYIISIFLR
jgi:Cu+-exporting ATPase